MAIRVENLSKNYGNQKALHHVSFQTGTNKIIGFLGPNGAGKTTCMKILTGIIPSDDGEAFINGETVKNNPIKVKASIGYLPENNPLYLDMYVRELLAFEANVHRIAQAEKRINEVIQLTGLTAEQHKKVNQLSKGYKQRVGLAMAIIHNPDTLILDEPTTGLDPNQIIEIRELIKELGKNRTVLFSTHIMQEVQAICQEILILNKGELKAHLQIDELAQVHPQKSMEEIFVHYTK